MIHPEDAQRNQIKNGQKIQAISRVGSVEIEAEITEEIMKGVVSIPHGWGHHRKNTQWKIAEEYAGVSINDLTDELLIDELSGNAAFSGVPVKVKVL